jgi:hypothetical protein
MFKVESDKRLIFNDQGVQQTVPNRACSAARPSLHVRLKIMNTGLANAPHTIRAIANRQGGVAFSPATAMRQAEQRRIRLPESTGLFLRNGRFAWDSKAVPLSPTHYPVGHYAQTPAKVPRIATYDSGNRFGRGRYGVEREAVRSLLHING